jgi:endoribonuclease Dicer
VLTGNSAVEHIFHFCSILPYSGLANNAPLFEIDPPDYPLEWHTDRGPRPPHSGSYGCTLTLPRLVDPRFRSFSTPRIHPSKVSARRHVAFQAYRVLYENKLLNDHLLPLTSTLEPDQESEVQLLLKEVEKREGMAEVSNQMDPWRVSGGSKADTRWWSITIEADGLPSLRMLTQAALPLLKTDELPVIHPRESPPFKVRVVGDQSPIIDGDDDGILARGKEFTRRLFWPMYSSRMKWDQTDFPYLFIPVDESPTIWGERRAPASDPGSFPSGSQALFSPFSSFVRYYGQVDGIHVVSGTGFTMKIFKFIRMRNTPITMEEKAVLMRRYVRRRRDDDDDAELEITYPLIEARPIVKRNFLTPMPDESKGVDAVSQKTVLLLQDSTMVAHLSSHEAQYALWAPSIIRHLQMACIVSSMRDTLFIETPLAQIPLNLLLTAITMPVARERTHYQRLETLGDTTLKYVVSIQLLSSHPLWHEGYLARRKDHAVSNANLAKMAIKRKLYKWIIRDIFIPRKWRPRRASDSAVLVFDETPRSLPDISEMTEKQKRRVNVARKLSTKVLADVVEALIGAAYFHGGFAMGIECMKIFDLDLSWRPLPDCIDAMYSRVTDFAYYPPQIGVVEKILGYTFHRKTIAVEALTHASYQGDLETISYERMEFLGDAVLDMLVTDYLYRAPGKDYKPGNIHLIKTAVVNAHFLAMLCLRAFAKLSAVMPTWSQDNGVTVTEDQQCLYLYKCLLHSNVHILDQQRATFARWERPGGRDEIEAALAEGRAFPWSALTSLQAPKFLSDMFESLLGAVYLDSLGDIDIVRGVLRRLGHWEVLERIVNCDMDVQHPISRLYMWASKHHEKVKCSRPKRDGNMVSCSVFWDDDEITKTEDEWRGRISQEGVRFAAAEEAIALLEDPVSLLRIWLAKRDRSIDYSMEEAVGGWACTAIVDGTRVATVQSPIQSGSGEETVRDLKRAAATEAFKKLEEPVHWLAFLSVQHDLEVGYEIYEEEGRKVCCVLVNGYEASRVKEAIKGPGSERDLMRKAAKEAIEGVELQIAMRTEVREEGANWGSSDEDWEMN